MYGYTSNISPSVVCEDNVAATRERRQRNDSLEWTEVFVILDFNSKWQYY